MKFTELSLSGAFLVELEPHADERGFFARAYSAREFRDHSLRDDLTEISLSRNLKAGTLRGMHFQRPPHEETKLVRVTRGRVFDVIVDIRNSSPTRGRWLGFELSSDNGQALYIPGGFAHGFLTLENQTDVLYQITDTFHADAADGFAWNDPTVAIKWPRTPTIISAADQSRPKSRIAEH